MIAQNRHLYTPQLAFEILERMAHGETVAAICRSGRKCRTQLQREGGAMTSRALRRHMRVPTCFKLVLGMII
jgi:hypothetical protein